MRGQHLFADSGQQLAQLRKALGRETEVPDRQRLGMAVEQEDGRTSELYRLATNYTVIT